MAELSSNQIRSAQFRSAIRGVDRVEVEAFLNAVADRIDELETAHQTLSAQIGETTSRDLESEFDAVGREVGGILQAAREASDAMRDRASQDAAKWRTEAVAESEEARRDAATDAEAMRRDAWTTGTELLQQSEVEATEFREQSERDVLTTMGEAEREAHRLTSGARREAEDLLRGATMDAEKTISDAAKRRDDLIDQANRQASAAQERTRALEQRRDELLDELENVRSTLTTLEGSLQVKRDTLDLTTQKEQSKTVRVVPTEPVDIENWEPGETVRIVRADDEPERYEIPLLVDPRVQAAYPDPDGPEVEEPEPKLEEPDGPEPEKPESAATEVPVRESEPESGGHIATTVDPETGSHVESKPETTSDDGDQVGALFASLRSGPEESPKSGAAETEEPVLKPTVVSADKDWIAVRDTRLLPITNRALRGAKKSMTELQNIALDSLRTDGEWRPDQGVISEALHADLVGLWSESFAAGHSVAEEMTGVKVKRPQTPTSDVTDDFGTNLNDAVTKALESAGEGQRERQSAASKVFRVWRTDEAERRIRDLAIKGYELGIEASVHANV